MKILAQDHLFVDKMCTKFQGQEMNTRKNIQNLPTLGGCEKSFTVANFDILSRIEKLLFTHEIFDLRPSPC